MFPKKGVLGNFAKFIGTHLARVSFLIKKKKPHSATLLPTTQTPKNHKFIYIKKRFTTKR